MIVTMNCAHYRYVVVEPNTFLDKNKPEHHIETDEDFVNYRYMVYKALPDKCPCMPLFLIKLTPKTTPSMIHDAYQAGAIGVKLYPEGVTTGSTHGGVSNFSSRKTYKCLEYLQEKNLVFQIHPEMPKTFCLSREHLFRDVLTQYAKDFPRLRIFVEHMTDRRMPVHIGHLQGEYGACIFGTITGHHLRLTLDNVLGQVDHHCWPCAKFPEDRDGLVGWATAGNDRIISITDSAPHRWQDKHDVLCGCAGVFNPAHIAIPSVVEVFEQQGAGGFETLDKFTSQNGLVAYGLSQSKDDTITLVKKNWEVPMRYGFGRGTITPFRAGQKLTWQIAE
jgi:dihydroorotase